MRNAELALKALVDDRIDGLLVEQRRDLSAASFPSIARSMPTSSVLKEGRDCAAPAIVTDVEDSPQLRVYFFCV